MLGGVDDVVFVAPDLGAAMADFRARGFTESTGGEHAGGLMDVVFP